jgi:hypothetical protein
MSPYRLFIFDRFGRKVEEERSFEADDDGTAVMVAEGWRSARKAELWQAHRQVETWVAGSRRRSI